MLFWTLLCNPAASLTFIPLRCDPIRCNSVQSLRFSSLHLDTIRFFAFLCLAFHSGQSFALHFATIRWLAVPCFGLHSRRYDAFPFDSVHYCSLQSRQFAAFRCRAILCFSTQFDALLTLLSGTMESHRLLWIALASAGLRSWQFAPFPFSSVLLHPFQFCPIRSIPLRSSRCVTILSISLRFDAIPSSHYLNFGSIVSACDSRSNEHDSISTENKPFPQPFPFVEFGRPSPSPFC